MNHIEKKYITLASTQSDINEHLPTLYQYAKECETILELGVHLLIHPEVHYVEQIAMKTERIDTLLKDVDISGNQS